MPSAKWNSALEAVLLESAELLGKGSFGQYRTIASAILSRLFAPLPQFQKWEIHTVFLHFRNFELGQKFWLRLLAELCGVAFD